MRISDWSSDVCSSDLLSVRLGIFRPVPEADRLRHGDGRAGEGSMMSVYVVGSAAAGTAFLSRVNCHLSRCTGAALIGIAVLLSAQPAWADQTIMAADSSQVDCQASAKDRKSTRLNSSH